MFFQSFLYSHADVFRAAINLKHKRLHLFQSKEKDRNCEIPQQSGLQKHELLLLKPKHNQDTQTCQILLGFNEARSTYKMLLYYHLIPKVDVLDDFCWFSSQKEGDQSQSSTTQIHLIPFGIAGAYAIHGGI